MVAAQEQGKKPTTQEYEWSQLQALNEGILSKMPLDDPLLRAAYATAFTVEGKHQAWEMAVFSDVQRRGNAVIPLLLSLFDENPEAIFRDELMKGVADWGIFKNIDHEPFLKAARELLHEKGRELDTRTRYAMVQFFNKAGNAADKELAKKINKLQLPTELEEFGKRFEREEAEAKARDQKTGMDQSHGARHVQSEDSTRPAKSISPPPIPTAKVSPPSAHGVATAPIAEAASLREGGFLWLSAALAAALAAAIAWLFARSRRNG